MENSPAPLTPFTSNAPPTSTATTTSPASPSLTGPELERVADLAREQGVKSRVIYSAARRGQLPVAMIGARLYARREDVAALFTPRLVAESR